MSTAGESASEQQFEDVLINDALSQAIRGAKSGGARVPIARYDSLSVNSGRDRL